MRHCVLEYQSLGEYVLEVAKVWEKVSLSMFDIYYFHFHSYRISSFYGFNHVGFVNLAEEVG